VFPLHQIADVGRQPVHGPNAIWPCNYFRRIPTYVITVPDRYGQTDGQTDRRTDDLQRRTTEILSSTITITRRQPTCWATITWFIWQYDMITWKQYEY